MTSCRRPTISPLLKAVFCLIFIGFIEINAHAGIGIPPIILTQPAGISVQNGDTAQISATVVPSLLSKQYYYWYCNGHLVTSNAAFSVGGLLSGNLLVSLTISNATAATAGSYTLCVTNGAGGIESSPATLIVLGSVVSNVVNIVSSGTGMALGGFKLQISAPTGSNVVIQASSDLNTWTSISTNTASSGTVTYTDTSAATRRCRFYRVGLK
jgi:hypothetical protein